MFTVSVKITYKTIMYVLSTASVLLFASVYCEEEPHTVTPAYQIQNSNSTEGKVLSRRKRFLVFPEGSSLQLVFCLTDASVSVIGDIVLWGSTAALAWELPQDPYSPYNHHADPLHRRSDQKHVFYTDDRGKLLFKVPYQRKAIVNPAFAKRSVDNAKLEENARTSAEAEPEAASDVDRKWMHEKQGKRNFLKIEGMSEGNIEFHRQSRTKLYEKLEIFLRALGMNGRQCVLRTLCESGRPGGDQQGTFVEELVRAVFTLPRGDEFEQQQQREYDAAHAAAAPGAGAGGGCELRYPDCDYGDVPEVRI